MPSAGKKNPKWLRCPRVGKVATSPLPYWGSPTWSAETKIKNSYVAHMRAKSIHHPCRLGVAQRSALGRKIRNAYMWTKWLDCPYHLRGPQGLTRGLKSEMAAWPTCVQSGYITPAVLGVPDTQRKNKNQKWLRGSHVGKVATSPLL